MFDVSLVDHIRLTFGHIAYRHAAHTRLARSRARWGRVLRVLSTLAITGTVVTSVATIIDFGGRERVYAVATASLAALAFVAVVADLLWAFENSAHAHGVCAGQLWHLRERYRALLSDLSDGAIDSNGARSRRDGLIDALRDIYESAPSVGWHAIDSTEADRAADSKAGEGREKTAAA